LGLFGLVLICLCFLEASGRRIYASEDVTQELGLRVIGTLPALPARARRKSAQAQSLGGLDSTYGMTESVDAVRTAVLHAHRGDGSRVILVTSAIGGEGKTTLASHLAASLARAWRKVLLIDADLRNPAQHTQFDVPGEPGLSEALRGEVEFEDAVRQTLLSRLWVMPAGVVDMHALQALSQEGMAAIFEKLKDEFDYIIIDTSPILPVPDALQLGPFVDSVLLAVMKDVSRMPALYQARERLEELGMRVLGTVVLGEKTETYGRAIPYPNR
jgi:capsular exopolysaccharide synthesis family protein